MPAEPVKPVSHASRSACPGTYSDWCSSARGTTKPCTPADAIAARSAAMRPAPAARSPASSKLWKRVAVGVSLMVDGLTTRSARPATGETLPGG